MGPRKPRSTSWCDNIWWSLRRCLFHPFGRFTSPSQEDFKMQIVLRCQDECKHRSSLGWDDWTLKFFSTLFESKPLSCMQHMYFTFRRNYTWNFPLWSFPRHNSLLRSWAGTLSGSFLSATGSGGSQQTLQCAVLLRQDVSSQVYSAFSTTWVSTHNGFTGM